MRHSRFGVLVSFACVVGCNESTDGDAQSIPDAGYGDVTISPDGESMMPKDGGNSSPTDTGTVDMGNSSPTDTGIGDTGLGDSADLIGDASDGGACIVSLTAAAGPCPPTFDDAADAQAGTCGGLGVLTFQIGASGRTCIYENAAGGALIGASYTDDIKSFCNGTSFTMQGGHVPLCCDPFALAAQSFEQLTVDLCQDGAAFAPEVMDAAKPPDGGL